MSTPASTPAEQPIEDFDESEKMMLESHIKKNQAAEPANFTMLYGLMSFCAVATVSYLFHTVLDLSILEPVNAILYLVSGGITCYFLFDSYMQMYETESNKGLSDENGKWIKELETRRTRKNDSIKNRDIKADPPAGQPRTMTEIFMQETGKDATAWKALDRQQRQTYQDKEYAEEVAYLGVESNELRYLQYQRSMGWSLLFCNGLFIAAALIVSQVLLRTYDNRVNYLASTLFTGLLTQLVAKSNDDAAKAKQASAKKRH